MAQAEAPTPGVSACSRVKGTRTYCSSFSVQELGRRISQFRENCSHEGRHQQTPCPFGTPLMTDFPKSCRDLLVRLLSILKLVDLHLSIRKHCTNLKASPHRFNVAAQCTDIHIGTPLEL
jgi:hypothetical protein